MGPPPPLQLSLSQAPWQGRLSLVFSHKRKESDLGKLLADCVSEKLEEGDFKGAVRLASSDDMLAPMSEATFQAHLERHPSPHPDSEISPIDDEVSTIMTVC